MYSSVSKVCINITVRKMPEVLHLCWLFMSYHKYYFTVIAILCLLDPIFLIADSNKLLARVLVIIDFDTGVIAILVLLNVIER